MSIRDIAARYDVLKRKNAERDARMELISRVRGGNAEMAFPGLFPRDWPKPIVANFLDTVARDLAEMVAPLPSFTAMGSSFLDEKGRTAADKRTKIANYYTTASKLSTQLLSGADQYLTYGFLPLRVEVNVGESRPHIHVDNPKGAYPEFDRWGRVTAYARRWKQKASDLAAIYPEYADRLMQKQGGGLGLDARKSDVQLEVVKWYDKDQCILFIPERGNLVLDSYANPISRVPVVVPRRPSLDGDIHGQFDDVLWVFAAKAKLALLNLEAVQDSVEAPIAVPMDVQHMPIGGKAVMRSNSPDQIRRVPLQLPPAAFNETQMLEAEMRIGARYPEARSGNIDASIVTGRGVQALMGGFDTQIKTAQAVIGEALAEIVSIALEMDEVVFADMRKTVQGNTGSSPYELTYTPSRDINGHYVIDVEYGVMSGLDPNRALVWGLQARGDKLISRTFLRRNLPVNMNVTDEERIIDIEEMRDALKASVQAYAQVLPELATSGQGDPEDVLRKISQIILARRKGEPIEDAIAAAFEPVEPAGAEPSGAEQPSDMNGAPVETAPPGSPPPQTTSSGVPAASPPPMQKLLAGLTGSGNPVLAGQVVRKVPA
jgi:hypothetical protein